MLTQLTHNIATPLSRRRWLGATAGLVLGLAAFTTAKAADDTIKVGVLRSLSGTMAISETTLKDTVLFLIEEQNKKGGVLGRKLEAVVVDPASNWPLFAEKARELLQKEKVAAVFGCWTSVSRKAVLPVFEELNGLLFYPVQYAGEESQRGVLQGARQRRHQGQGYPGGGVLGRRRRARRRRHQAAGRPSRRLELLPVGEEPRQRGLHQDLADLHQESEARDERSDGSARDR